MKHIFISLVVCLIFTTTLEKAYGQAELWPISHDLNNKAGKKIYFRDSLRNHTALQSYFVDDLSDTSDRDSLFQSLFPAAKEWQSKNWLYRKLFTEHLIEVKNADYSFYADFLPDLQIGKQGNKNLWLNTRGVQVGGKIGKKFAFYSYFFENQGSFAQYYTFYSFNNKVVPGQGRTRPFGNDGLYGALDYNYSGGSISYTPSKYVNFQMGYDKNFIGDGYRSLLLSDNAFNYPFFKITATLGRVRYMAMWAQFIDFSDHEFGPVDTPLPKKYGVFHYLSWNATDRLSLGLFENVMWANRGFEAGYLNPIIFLRPVEFANGSPDKALLGLNASYKIADRYVAYGQFMLNEFRAKDVFSGKGHWANKQGGQLGIKGFDIFNVNNLYAQVEMNRVRPYSYSANDHFKNYGHYNQPLAHPFGANFQEWLGIVNYRYKRFDARLQLTSATYGLDPEGMNYGKDIYKSYETRPSDEGLFIGNGIKTKLLYTNATLAYVLNPKNNLRLEIGYTYRKESNSQINDKQQMINIGLRSSFRNLYSDF